MGENEYGIDPAVPERIAKSIHGAWEDGVQIAVVVGGGNIFRGVSGAAAGMDRAQGDNMGMLATVINALALQDCFERNGMYCRVQSAIEMRQVAEPYIRRRAIRHLEKGRIVIFAAGTGNPYFTTDTAAVLRALEIRADVVMKATRVDGVYDEDPEKNPNATRYSRLDYTTVLRDNLQVMDAAGISLARENRLPIFVFNMLTRGNIVKAVRGDDIGTLISDPA